MIEKPDMDKAVFCRVVRTPSDGGEITLRYVLSDTGLRAVAKKSPWKKETYS